MSRIRPNFASCDWSYGRWTPGATSLLLAGRPTGFLSTTPAARERYLLGWAGLAHPAAPVCVRGVPQAPDVPRLCRSGCRRPEPAPGGVDYRPGRSAGDRRAKSDPALGVPATTLPPGGPVTLDADAVIVGSGAGGGVVAAALSAAGRSVIVLEAGPYVDETTMPRTEVDAFDRQYLDHGLLTTWDGSVTMLAGTGVGGGTLVNWTTCIPAPETVRAGWDTEHGLEGMTGGPWAADVAAIEARARGRRVDPYPAKGRDHPARRAGARLGGGADAPQRDCAAGTAAVARSGAGAGPSDPASGPTSPAPSARAPGSCRTLV